MVLVDRVKGLRYPRPLSPDPSDTPWLKPKKPRNGSMKEGGFIAGNADDSITEEPCIRRGISRQNQADQSLVDPRLWAGLVDLQRLVSIAERGAPWCIVENNGSSNHAMTRLSTKGLANIDTRKVHTTMANGNAVITSTTDRTPNEDRNPKRKKAVRTEHAASDLSTDAGDSAADKSPKMTCGAAEMDTENRRKTALQRGSFDEKEQGAFRDLDETTKTTVETETRVLCNGAPSTFEKLHEREEAGVAMGTQQERLESTSSPTSLSSSSEQESCRANDSFVKKRDYDGAVRRSSETLSSAEEEQRTSRRHNSQTPYEAATLIFDNWEDTRLTNCLQTSQSPLVQLEGTDGKRDSGVLTEDGGKERALEADVQRENNLPAPRALCGPRGAQGSAAALDAGAREGRRLAAIAKQTYVGLDDNEADLFR